MHPPHPVTTTPGPLPTNPVPASHRSWPELNPSSHLADHPYRLLSAPLEKGTKAKASSHQHPHKLPHLPLSLSHAAAVLLLPPPPHLRRTAEKKKSLPPCFCPPWPPPLPAPPRQLLFRSFFNNSMRKTLPQLLLTPLPCPCSESPGIWRNRVVPSVGHRHLAVEPLLPDHPLHRPTPRRCSLSPGDAHRPNPSLSLTFSWMSRAAKVAPAPPLAAGMRQFPRTPPRDSPRQELHFHQKQAPKSPLFSHERDLVGVGRRPPALARSPSLDLSMAFS